jgi:M6 family metalloprotease-like protein
MKIKTSTGTEHRLFLAAVIFSLLLLLSGQAHASKQNVTKKLPARAPKVHPYTHMLSSGQSKWDMPDKAMTNNKLLVILIDFQEELPDDPLTTGNGKFQLEPDPDYRTTIASPPHNREYFEENLRALKYYYLAASHNDFNLEYDVYPKEMPAYTLPNRMSYYSPPNASSALFLARIEEYFKHSFELADSLDPDIDFSVYGHFMIIHAGSDWQHDVFGDTPSDLPSFFIRAAPGKEAVVNNGSVLINKACNVPSTISQDFDSYDVNGDVYYTGYGALNGVMAHEFGHSLGAVDLYNVYNFQPMVGFFDIMDSGGAGITEDPGSPGVLIEGQLPALPGAFTRMVMFEDSYRQRGFLKDINQLTEMYSLGDLISVSASSQKQTQTAIIQNLVKIPLSEHEYILIENRSVDPDNDGGTAILGALDNRVALHPTGFYDPNNLPTYEYDYLLPSFIDLDFNAIGGGILVWHVDENLLFNQGQTDSVGNFVSNFENNTVNYNYNRRGVRVIEADGLDDLGNVYSWLWTGTPYEYFHRYKPNLDANGWFLNWTNDDWRPVLNYESKPPLRDYQGHPSFYGFRDISQPSALMSFRLTAGAFDGIRPLGDPNAGQKPLPVINSQLSDNVLPVKRNNSIHFYIYDPAVGIDDWRELINPIALADTTIVHTPIVSNANNDGFREVVLSNWDGFSIIEFNDDTPSVLSVSAPIYNTPLYAFDKLFLPSAYGYQTPDTLLQIPYQVQTVAEGKLAATDETLVSFNNYSMGTNSMLLVHDPNSMHTLESYNFPELLFVHEPVIVKDSLSGGYTYYVIGQSGDIYKCSQNTTQRIFHSNQHSIPPTNLAISPIGGYSPCIVFAQGNRVYAMKHDGTLLPGYPVFLEGYTASPYSHIKIRLQNDRRTGNSSEVIYIELDTGGIIAINADGSINNQNSIMDKKRYAPYHTYYIPDESKLFWFYINNNDYLMAAEQTDIEHFPFLWSGFRNGGTGMTKLRYYEPAPVSEQISAYVFPNPAKNGWLTLRVENPEGLVEFNVYDIAGKLLYKTSYSTDPVTYKDTQIDVSRFSSGVYLVSVKNSGQTKRLKFAVEK